MEHLIREIVPPQSVLAVTNLYNDMATRKIIQEELSNIFLNHGIVLSEPTNQLLLIVSKANFADTEEECVLIASIIYRYCNQEVLPLVHQHHGMDLASRCLVSLSLFRKAMDVLHNHHGAPHPEFYRRVGIHAFSQTNHNQIANHFQNWENFLSEMLV